MAVEKKRGALIVFEGCDRSGKSSQCQILFEKLKEAKCNVQIMRFPDRTTVIGKMIDGYLKGSKELNDHVVHLLFSANRWEAASLIERLVEEEGAIVLVDRYIYSGIAFSAAKGMQFDWCKAPDVGLPLPDLVIYLDLDPKEAVSRGSYGEERYERLEFQQKVYEMYGRLQDDRWIVVDAKQPMDCVTADIATAVDNLLSKCSNLTKLDRFC